MVQIAVELEGAVIGAPLKPQVSQIVTEGAPAFSCLTRGTGGNTQQSAGRSSSQADNQGASSSNANGSGFSIGGDGHGGGDDGNGDGQPPRPPHTEHESSHARDDRPSGKGSLSVLADLAAKKHTIRRLTPTGYEEVVVEQILDKRSNADGSSSYAVIIQGRPDVPVWESDTVLAGSCSDLIGAFEKQSPLIANPASSKRAKGKGRKDGRGRRGDKGDLSDDGMSLDPPVAMAELTSPQIAMGLPAMGAPFIMPMDTASSDDVKDALLSGRKRRIESKLGDETRKLQRAAEEDFPDASANRLVGGGSQLVEAAESYLRSILYLDNAPSSGVQVAGDPKEQRFLVIGHFRLPPVLGPDEICGCSNTECANCILRKNPYRTDLARRAFKPSASFNFASGHVYGVTVELYKDGKRVDTPAYTTFFVRETDFKKARTEKKKSPFNLEEIMRLSHLSSLTPNARGTPATNLTTAGTPSSYSSLLALSPSPSLTLNTQTLLQLAAQQGTPLVSAGKLSDAPPETPQRSGTDPATASGLDTSMSNRSIPATPSSPATKGSSAKGRGKQFVPETEKKKAKTFTGSGWAMGISNGSRLFNSRTRAKLYSWKVEWARKSGDDKISLESSTDGTVPVPSGAVPALLSGGSHPLGSVPNPNLVANKQPCNPPSPNQVAVSCAFIQSERDRRYNAYSMAFSSSNWNVVVLKKFSKRSKKDYKKGGDSAGGGDGGKDSDSDSDAGSDVGPSDAQGQSGTKPAGLDDAKLDPAGKKLKEDKPSAARTRRCPCCKRSNRQRSLQICFLAPKGYSITLRDEFSGRPMMIFSEPDSRKLDQQLPADNEDYVPPGAGYELAITQEMIETSRAYAVGTAPLFTSQNADVTHRSGGYPVAGLVGQVPPPPPV